VLRRFCSGWVTGGRGLDAIFERWEEYGGNFGVDG
jgi:hypothetical protein